MNNDAINLKPAKRKIKSTWYWLIAVSICGVLAWLEWTHNIAPWFSQPPLRLVHGHGADKFENGISPMGFSPNGKLMVTQSFHNTLELWNAQMTTVPKTLPRSDNVRAVAVSPNSKVLAGSSDDTKTMAKITLWDMPSGKILKTWLTSQSLLPAVAFSPDGTILASGDGDGLVQLWQIATGTLQRTLKLTTQSQGAIHDLVFSPDGQEIAVNYEKGPVQLWNWHTGIIQRQIQWISKGVIFIPQDKANQAWLKAQKINNNLYLIHPSGQDCVAISPNNKIVALGGVEDQELGMLGGPQGVRLCDATSGTTIMTLGEHDNPYDGDGMNYVKEMAFSPDSKTLACGNGDGTVSLWDLSHLKS